MLFSTEPQPGLGLVVGLGVVNGGTVATPEEHNSKHK